MSQYEYKQLDDRHPESPTCNSFQGEHIDVGPYVPASIAREIELRKSELERENARLREGFAPAINAIEIKARANEEAASRATEASDISWSKGVAAGLRLALSILPNVY